MDGVKGMNNRTLSTICRPSIAEIVEIKVRAVSLCAIVFGQTPPQTAFVGDRPT